MINPELGRAGRIRVEVDHLSRDIAFLSEEGDLVVMTEEEAFGVTDIIARRRNARIARSGQRTLEEATGGPSDPAEVFDPGAPQDASGRRFSTREFWETALNPPRPASTQIFDPDGDLERGDGR